MQLLFTDCHRNDVFSNQFPHLANPPLVIVPFSFRGSRHCSRVGLTVSTAERSLATTQLARVLRLCSVEKGMADSPCFTGVLL